MEIHHPVSGRVIASVCSSPFSAAKTDSPDDLSDTIAFAAGSVTSVLILIHTGNIFLNSV